MTLFGTVLIGRENYRTRKLSKASSSDSCTSKTVYSFVNCSKSLTCRPGLLSFNCPHDFRSLPSHCGQGSQLPSSSLNTVAPHDAQIVCVTVPKAMINSPRPLL